MLPPAARPPKPAAARLPPVQESTERTISLFDGGMTPADQLLTLSDDFFNLFPKSVGDILRQAKRDEEARRAGRAGMTGR